MDVILNWINEASWPNRLVTNVEYIKDTEELLNVYENDVVYSGIHITFTWPCKLKDSSTIEIWFLETKLSNFLTKFVTCWMLYHESFYKVECFLLIKITLDLYQVGKVVQQFLFLRRISGIFLIFQYTIPLMHLHCIFYV